MKRMVAFNKSDEPETLVYKIFINEDQKLLTLVAYRLMQIVAQCYFMMTDLPRTLLVIFPNLQLTPLSVFMVLYAICRGLCYAGWI